MFTAFYFTLRSQTAQPSISLSLHDGEAAFRPSYSIIDGIDRLYQRNRTCSLPERLRFDEVRLKIWHDAPLICNQVAGISASEYTFVAPKDRTEPIYTRHPISNVVTKHEHPFNTLPCFSLSAHPVFVLAQAYRTLMWHGDASDKICQIGRTVTRSVSPDFLREQVPSTSTTSPPASFPRLLHSRATALSSVTSCSPPENSRCKRRRCEIHLEPGVAAWVDQVRAIAFDELPQDNIALYSSEPSKPYATVVGSDQAWLAVMERKRKRHQCGDTVHVAN